MHYIVYEMGGEKGDLVSTITSAPQFTWSDVLNLFQMKSVERLDI